MLTHKTPDSYQKHSSYVRCFECADDKTKSAIMQVAATKLWKQWLLTNGVNQTEEEDFA